MGATGHKDDCLGDARAAREVVGSMSLDLDNGAINSFRRMIQVTAVEVDDKPRVYLSQVVIVPDSLDNRQPARCHCRHDWRVEGPRGRIHKQKVASLFGEGVVSFSFFLPSLKKVGLWLGEAPHDGCRQMVWLGDRGVLFLSALFYVSVWPLSVALALCDFFVSIKRRKKKSTKQR